MKTLFLASIVFTAFLLPKVSAQQLVSTEYEKGYLKKGKKFSVWEYYNTKHELELKINHSTGKVYYLKPDTTDYVIFDNGQWTRQKLRFYPTPAIGYRNFAHQVLNKLHTLARNISDGEVAVMFEVDTAGLTINFEVLKDLDGNAGRRLVDAIKFAGPWAPARIEKKPYKSRFILSVNHSTGSDSTYVPSSMVPIAKRVAYSVLGISRKFPDDEYSTLGAIDPYKTGERLSFANQQLTSVPDSVFEAKKLVVLDLERNSIAELPDEIAALEKLRGLYLPWNKLKQLPEAIANLKHLTTLSIGANQFTEFPAQLCNLVRLKALDLADNKIDKIPPCIANLKDLEIISLANNNLTRLPDEFFQLKKLKVIYLNDNNFNQATINRVNTTFKKARIVWTSKEQSKK